jgi:hypothetical protein
MVSPALSSDGRIVAFASTEDLTGENADRNSEIFLFDGFRDETVDAHAAEIDRNAADGWEFSAVDQFGWRVVVYSSGGEILSTAGERLAQGESPKISGDGLRLYFKNRDLRMVDMQTRVTTTVASDIEDFAVSDDGKRVVYSAQTQLFLYDGGIRQLTQLGARTTDVKLQPSISGDGKRVALRHVAGSRMPATEASSFTSSICRQGRCNKLPMHDECDSGSRVVNELRRQSHRVQFSTGVVRAGDRWDSRITARSMWRRSRRVPRLNPER